jgi:hypothetical protein
LDHIDATFRVSGATGAYVALKFAGIGRTPQFAIGTSLILRWELCCDAKKNPALT